MKRKSTNTIQNQKVNNWLNIENNNIENIKILADELDVDDLELIQQKHNEKKELSEAANLVKVFVNELKEGMKDNYTEDNFDKLNTHIINPKQKTNVFNEILYKQFFKNKSYNKNLNENNNNLLHENLYSKRSKNSKNSKNSKRYDDISSNDSKQKSKRISMINKKRTYRLSIQSDELKDFLEKRNSIQVLPEKLFQHNFRNDDDNVIEKKKSFNLMNYGKLRNYNLDNNGKKESYNVEHNCYDMKRRNFNLNNYIRMKSYNRNNYGKIKSYNLDNNTKIESNNLNNFGKTESYNLDNFRKIESHNLDNFGKKESYLDNFGKKEHYNLDNFRKIESYNSDNKMKSKNYNLDNYGKMKSDNLNYYGKIKSYNLENYGKIKSYISDNYGKIKSYISDNEYILENKKPKNKKYSFTKNYVESEKNEDDNKNGDKNFIYMIKNKLKEKVLHTTNIQNNNMTNIEKNNFYNDEANEKILKQTKITNTNLIK